MNVTPERERRSPYVPLLRSVIAARRLASDIAERKCHAA